MEESLQRRIEEFESGDAGERCEALDGLWNAMIHQGSPGREAASILAVLLDWVRHEHEDWPDILEGIAVCAGDLENGATRAEPEQSRRLDLLDVIKAAHELFESVLRRPCAWAPGRNCTHVFAADLLRISLPARAEVRAPRLVEFLRVDPTIHSGCWDTLDCLGTLESLSSEDLRWCCVQPGVPRVQRAARFALASRGDRDGIEAIRRSVDELILNRFAPSAEEAALVVRAPENIPLNLLLRLYHRSIELRAVHDLALGILRNAASDGRAGWEVVHEKRVGSGLVIRHPDVPKLASGDPPRDLVRLRRDLLRHGRIHLVDTDAWRLFGFPQP